MNVRGTYIVICQESELELHHAQLQTTKLTFRVTRVTFTRFSGGISCLCAPISPRTTAKSHCQRLEDAVVFESIRVPKFAHIPSAITFT